MAGTIKHRFVNPVVDEGVSTETGPDEWNDSLVVAGGLDSDVFVRRTSAGDGWELIKLGASPTWVNATDANNVGTGETDLHSWTIPASHFNVNKRAIRLKASGKFAANANTKTLRIKFGSGTAIVLNPTTTAPNNVRFDIEYTVIRTASNVQRGFYRVLLGTGVELMGLQAEAETDTGTIVLKITGQSAVAGNDVTLEYSAVEYLG